MSPLPIRMWLRRSKHISGRRELSPSAGQENERGISRSTVYADCGSPHRQGATMKLWLISASLFTIGVLVGAQSDSSGVVHVDPAKVAAAIAKGGSLVTRPDLLVSGSHREAAGKVEVHDKETDVLYVIEGEATFVFGGQMVGGKVTAPGQWQGSDITGGEAHHIAKG